MASKRPIPLRCTWTGTAFEPFGRALAYCQEEFGQGEVLVLERREERSEPNHRHYFAALHEAWMNLPESATDQFPTVEHLRAFALIRAGYADHNTIKCASTEEAIALAVFVRKGLPLSISSIEGDMVTIWTAKSQSRRSMKKAEFQASKEAVLDYVASLVDVTPRQLEKNADGSDLSQGYRA